MKKILGLLLAIAIVIAAVPYARSLGASPAAGGFVISRPSPGDPWPAAGVVKGYFMVRQGNDWLRVDSGQELQVQPATITR
jgi:hypothetical protein